MLKHDDLDTIHSNLFELSRMINYKSSDPYIKSMYQYIVNPIAWVVTEQAVRASKNIEDSKNSSQAVQQTQPEVSLRDEIYNIVRKNVDSANRCWVITDDVMEKIAKQQAGA